MKIKTWREQAIRVLASSIATTYTATNELWILKQAEIKINNQVELKQTRTTTKKV